MTLALRIASGLLALFLAMVAVELGAGQLAMSAGWEWARMLAETMLAALALVLFLVALMWRAL